jgi:SAM-dependent methyltransferase
MSSCPACGGVQAVRGLRISEHLSLACCADCKTAWASPRPDEATLAAVYGRHYYDAWGLGSHGALTAQMKRRTFRSLLDWCAPWLAEHARILDLGCATGFFLDEVRSRGHEGFGVDISEFAIRECEKRFECGRFFCGEFESASFAAYPEGRFDAIFMSDYLEHVRDPHAVLATARERLAPGGALVITTPNVSSPSRRLMGGRWPHFKTEHLWYFSPSGLRSLLRSAGFRVVASRPTVKRLSLAYLGAQSLRYPGLWAAPLFVSLDRCLPERILHFSFPLRTGELSVVGIASGSENASFPPPGKSR